jgi:hypothetical protein
MSAHQFDRRDFFLAELFKSFGNGEMDTGAHGFAHTLEKCGTQVKRLRRLAAKSAYKNG